MKPFLLALITSLIWGLVPILEKSGLVRVAPHIGLYARSTGVLIGLVFYSFFVTPRQAWEALDRRSFMLLAAGGFLASFVAQFIFYHSLKAGDASRMTAIAGMYPLFTFILAGFFLGEPFSPGRLAGVVLIIAGVTLLR